MLGNANDLIVKEKEKKRRFKRFRRKKERESRPRAIYVNDLEKNSTSNFAANYIKTTKYTLITFLPKNLFEQVSVLFIKGSAINHFTV